MCETECPGCAIAASIVLIIVLVIVICVTIECFSDGEFSDRIGEWISSRIKKLPKPKD